MAENGLVAAREGRMGAVSTLTEGHQREQISISKLKSHRGIMDSMATTASNTILLI